MHPQRLQQCVDHARHAGTGDGLFRTPVEAVAGITIFFPRIFSMSLSTPNAASTARIFANRACAAPHMVWLTRASPQNGRQAATGGGRGGSRNGGRPHGGRTQLNAIAEGTMDVQEVMRLGMAAAANKER